HEGWDHWDRKVVVAPAPLPVYQRQYSGARYPGVSEQVVIHTTKYTYQPREVVVQERYKEMRASAPAHEGHPPGRAKGWEGENHAPGKAKGHDKEEKEHGHGKGHEH